MKPAVISTTNEHIEEARTWLLARNIDASPHLFSTTGYVVPGVAAIWLYRTNSCIAYLEMLAANPAVYREERSAAIDAVIERAIDEAKRAGYLVLMAPAQMPHVVARGKRLGFDETPGLTLLARSLVERKD